MQNTSPDLVALRKLGECVHSRESYRHELVLAEAMINTMLAERDLFLRLIETQTARIAELERQVAILELP